MRMQTTIYFAACAIVAVCSTGAVQGPPTEAILAGDWKAAVADLETLLKRKPDDEVAHYLVSMASYFQGQHAKQRSAGLSALRKNGAIDRILQWARAFATDHPDRAIAHLFLADLYAGKTQHTQAIAEDRKALQLAPKYVAAKVNLATNLAAIGDVEKAIVLLQEAQMDAPSDPNVYCVLGSIYSDILKDHGQALFFFKRAIEADNTIPGAYLNLGILSEKQHDYPTALRYYEKAASFDSGYPDAHCRIGYIHCTNQQWDLGMAELQKAIKLDPNHPEAYGILGVAFLEGKGDRTRAVAAFRKAIELDPKGEYGRMAKLCLDQVGE